MIDSMVLLSEMSEKPASQKGNAPTSDFTSEKDLYHPGLTMSDR
jgi:hypothetical protein